MINLIVAFDKNYIIGKDNSIPWHIPEDLANFKKLTTNNVCVMGRNTWESLPDKYRPLPNRTNIIVSKKYQDEPESFIKSFGRRPDNDFHSFVVKSLDEALSTYLNYYKDIECYIIGGRQIYENCLQEDYVDRMIITRINKEYDGDVKFPDINWNQWKETILDSNINFSIIQYDRID